MKVVVRYRAELPTSRETDLKPAACRSPRLWLDVVPSLAHPPTSGQRDRKSTRLNSSHLGISYAVFCLKKKVYSGKSGDGGADAGSFFDHIIDDLDVDKGTYGVVHQHDVGGTGLRLAQRGERVRDRFLA